MGSANARVRFATEPFFVRGGAGATLLLVCTLQSACHRTMDGPYDFEALKIEACEDACETLNTCDPDRFDGLEPAEPEACFDRCMTLLPFLHEENQCGSRQLTSLQCLGELTCDELAEHDQGNTLDDDSAPCVAELDAVYVCSTSEPFDLSEEVD